MIGRPVSSIALALVLVSAAQGQTVPGARPVARQVAAPASDIESGLLRLPDPRAEATRCRAALFELVWRPDGPGAWRAEVTLPVSAGPLAYAVQAHGAGAIEMSLEVGGEAPRSAGASVARSDQELGAELSGEQVQRHDLVLAAGGEARFTLRLAAAPEAPRARLAIRDAHPLTAAANVDRHELVVGGEFALVAQVERNHPAAGPQRALPAVDRAWVELEGPSGTTRLQLADDGESGDGRPGDGVLGVMVPATESGDFAALVTLAGSSGGDRFLRTTRVTFTVAEPAVLLTGGVSTEVEDARRLRLDVDALLLGERRRLLVAAEVWGHDPSGEARPMAWLARIAAPTIDPHAAGHVRLPLWFDAGWFSHAGLQPPLELRNVRVQDPDHLGVLASAAALPVPAGPLPPLAGRGTVDPASLFGVTANASAPPTTARPIDPILPNPGLVLSHGYCASGNPFPTSDFSQPRFVFSDTGENRSHDAFARRIMSQASAYTSFGVVGHSQGGNAALHLLTYYQSPLDRSEGERRIQSVGAPYQGTPLASLGFFACGVNNNLTTSGGAVWLAGIPTWAREECFFHTTEEGGFFACQIFTALLLANPEDGTTERSRGQLPGGRNMGHVSGWCHTTFMADPPQCQDGGRNAVMDALAAR